MLVSSRSISNNRRRWQLEEEEVFSASPPISTVTWSSVQNANTADIASLPPKPKIQTPLIRVMRVNREHCLQIMLMITWGQRSRRDRTRWLCASRARHFKTQPPTKLQRSVEDICIRSAAGVSVLILQLCSLLATGRCWIRRSDVIREDVQMLMLTAGRGWHLHLLFLCLTLSSFWFCYQCYCSLFIFFFGFSLPYSLCYFKIIIKTLI